MSCPVCLEDIVSKTDINYTGPCQDESWDILFRGERILHLFSVGWMDQVKKLWLIQVTEARMELMETTKDKRDQISQSVEVIKRIL